MKLSGEHRCQCAKCGKYFANTRSFDKHQIDQFENLKQPVLCMTVAQLEAKGLVKDTRGFWMIPNRPYKAARQVSTKNDAGVMIAAAA